MAHRNYAKSPSSPMIVNPRHGVWDTTGYCRSITPSRSNTAVNSHAEMPVQGYMIARDTCTITTVIMHHYASGDDADNRAPSANDGTAAI